MPTAYTRLAEARTSRRFHVIAGRPIADRAVADPKPNPWADAASDERLLAAAFADRVVLFVCLAIGVLMLADFVAPDLAAWIAGHPAVMVAR